MFADVPGRLAPADLKRWRGIQDFEETSPSLTSSVLRVASAPLEAVVPTRARQALVDALVKAVDMLREALAVVDRPDALLKEAGASDLDAWRRDGDAGRMVELARAQGGPAILKATLQGAGLGLGGVTLAIADVPLLLAAHLQLLVRLGYCFGLDLRPDDQRPYLLALLEAGYCLTEREERRRALRGLDAMLAEGASPRGEGQEVARQVLNKAAGSFAEKVAPLLLRRRFGAVIPLLGSAIGAGANFGLTRDLAQLGGHALLKRVLVERARG